MRRRRAASRALICRRRANSRSSAFASWRIAPGIFKTPMMAGMREDVQKSLAESIPFPKLLGTPEEYAMLALHMVENRYLNGELVRLDGALRMAPRSSMFSNSRIMRIEWQHCDPAGIVFYPRYFVDVRFLDDLSVRESARHDQVPVSSSTMISSAIRWSTRARNSTFRACSATTSKSRPAITEVKRSSFSIEHQILKDGALAVEGWETRVWVGKDPADPDEDQVEADSAGRR